MSGPQRSHSRTFPELAGTSLWILPHDSRLRHALYRLVTSRWFDYAMFGLIILNCVAMAYEYPDMSRGSLDGDILFWRCVRGCGCMGHCGSGLLMP